MNMDVVVSRRNSEAGSNARAVEPTTEQLRRFRGWLASSSRSRMFGKLTPNQVDDIVANSTLLEYDAGETIVNYGDKGKRFYIVESIDNSCDVYAPLIATLAKEKDEQVRLTKVLSLRRGQHFGELSLLYDYNRHATVKAGGNPERGDRVLVWAIERKDFERVAQKSDHLLKLFEKYATVKRQNASFMTPQGLILALHDAELEASNWGSSRTMLNELHPKMKLIMEIADVDKTGLITFPEFVQFYHLMSKPNPEYDIAFRLFDRNGDGKVSLQEIIEALEKGFSLVPDQQPTNPENGNEQRKFQFNFECDMIQRYFGSTKTTGSRRSWQRRAQEEERELNYDEFAQFFDALQDEIVKQHFQYFDTEQRGMIAREQFYQVLDGMSPAQLPSWIRDRMNEADPFSTSSTVSYAYFTALLTMLNNLPLIESTIRNLAMEQEGSFFTKDDLRNAAILDISSNLSIALGDILSPSVLNVLWQVYDIDGDGYLSMQDLYSLTQRVDPISVLSSKASKSNPSNHPKNRADQSLLQRIQKFASSFMLGSIAGAIGAFAVYPIDLVKTRMQNQRSGGELLYKNSLDCFRKVIRKEGFLGLYSGLLPQMVGVAPEKAIKLTVNDVLRKWFSKDDEEIAFPLEVLSGSLAGASQVIVTNPLEIVKIRMQVSGEGGVRKGAVQIIRELGFFGLYRGAGACLLRDIPFSGIYFPCYAAAKDYLSNHGTTQLSPMQLLASGMIAGMPAAYLTTPADVIKTRLQVETVDGRRPYKSIPHAFTTIIKEEGPSALFKGGPARVFRSSPQFGVTLLSYELLQRYLFKTEEYRPFTNVPLSRQDVQVFRHETVSQKLSKVLNRLESINPQRKSG